uniref:Uncharacterized protein n=1 Tax=Saimiri boliviensis boliviensis TaxID=39432 RepID=A0A2K6ULI4_SAIBB
GSLLQGSEVPEAGAPQPPHPPPSRGSAKWGCWEFEDFSSLPDTRSIASDDSFYPFEDEEEQGVESAESVPEGVPEAASLLRAACANDVGLLRALVRRGVSVEEAQETDRNGRTGLIVACYHGFVDIVVALAECPHVDVNWQDSEGNTALITAAQAGKSGAARVPMGTVALDTGCQPCASGVSITWLVRTSFNTDLV